MIIFSSFLPLILFFLAKDFIFLGSGLFLDSNLNLLNLIFPLVLFLILVVSFNFLGGKEKIFFSLGFIFVCSFLFFCFNSTNPFLFLIFLENCVIFMISLVFWFSKDLDKISSALFMFLINIAPSILFIFFCWYWIGNLIVSIFNLHQSSDFYIFFCFLGLLLRKLPLFFFHFWLTKAHVRASGCGSIILASLLLKIGSVGLYKFYYIFIKNFKNLRSLLFNLVVFRRVLLLLIIIRFFDLKYVVACSSIIHMAPIFPFCLWGNSNCVFSSFLIIVGHGLISYFIFFLVTLIYEVRYHRSLDFNKRLGSYSKTLISFFIFFFLMNLGFPPFVGFLRELIFFFSFIQFRYIVSFVFSVCLILRGLTFFFVVSKTLFGKKSIYNVFYLNLNIFSFTLIYLFVFFLLPFIYFYSYSLIKISFCGSEDFEGIDFF